MDYSKLTKEELISVIKDLQNDELGKARDLFLSNISHDIRTLLNAIYGNAQILNSDDSLDASQKKFLLNIIYASSHIIDLINNIISVSRSSDGDKLILTEFNLFELLNSIYSVFKNVAKSKNIDLELNTNVEETVLIKTDKNKIFYILLNLLGNAFKYTDSGKVTFTCTIKEEKIYFEIKDTGFGIEENKIAELTKQYYRGENSHGTQGFGLGLGIVSKNLSLLGSSIKIKSKVGCGSSFSFKIKCQRNKKTFVSTQNNIFEMKKIDYIKQPNDFIVVIYGKTFEKQSVLSTYFNSRQIDYICMNNIKDLETKVEQKIVKMIFLDLKTLNNEDLTFFKKLKTSFSNLPIVSLTSSVMSGDLEKINDISTTYIVEPYSFLDLDQSLIMFTNEEFVFDEEIDEKQKHNIIISENIKTKLIDAAKLGSFKKCYDTINLITDNNSKEILLEYLNNYDFSMIINTIEKEE